MDRDIQYVKHNGRKKIMIKVIGTIGCQKCKQTVRELNSRDIDFSYRFLNELSDEQADKYIEKASIAGQKNFPIILKDDELVNLEEIIN